MIHGFKVIDADAHMQEPSDLWDNYVESEFYERRPKVEAVEHRVYYRYAESELFPASGLPTSVWKKRPKKMFERMPEKYGQAYENWWTAESRLVDMEKYGWDKMVCIPGIGSAPLSQQGRDPDLMWALTRAYHNWAHDFCSADPNKLKMVVDLPTYDIERTIVETRRAVAELGAVTVMMPKPLPGKFWHEPEYAPFWNLIEELDVPLAFHGVGSAAPHAPPDNSVPRRRQCRAPCRNWRYDRTIWSALRSPATPVGDSPDGKHDLPGTSFRTSECTTGIFDRHPSLRCSFLRRQRRMGPILAGST